MFWRALRIIAIWIAFMSGTLSIAKDFYFAYLASADRPVPPHSLLAILGHLSLAAFVLSGLTAWILENQRFRDCQKQRTKKPVFVARRKILELEKRGKAMKAKLVKNKLFIPSSRKIERLREEFEEALETYMGPHERAELLSAATTRIDDTERSGHMLDFTDKKMELFDKLHPLVRLINIASQRIDNLRD
jgi:hypothetical protein